METISTHKRRSHQEDSRFHLQYLHFTHQPAEYFGRLSKKGGMRKVRTSSSQNLQCRVSDRIDFTSNTSTGAPSGKLNRLAGSSSSGHFEEEKIVYAGSKFMLSEGIDLFLSVANARPDYSDTPTYGD